MTYKYAVFDWDGTLADTYPAIAAAFDYTFEKMSQPEISYDEIRKITGTLQNKDTMGYLFGEKKQEAAKFFYEYIEKHHTQNLVPQPEAGDLLEFCKNRNINCYLFTNKTTKFIYAELKFLGFTEYFKKIVAAGEYAEDKPHPIACSAVFDGNIPPVNEIVVIGDGDADVKTAKALGGADCIIYDRNNTYKGEKPKYKVCRLFDAIKILEKNNA